MLTGGGNLHFFLLDVVMTMDEALVVNIPSGLLGTRNIGLAKQPRRPSSPVLPYVFESELTLGLPSRKETASIHLVSTYSKRKKNR